MQVRTAAIQSTAAVFASIFAITITGERPHFVVLLGTLTVIGTLMSDIMLGILDPRIRIAG